MTMILDWSICSLGEYRQLKQERLKAEWEKGDEQHRLLVPERPERCPDCGVRNRFWVHSYRYRWAIDENWEVVVPVPRFECSACTKVVSVMFAFLVPYRQFTLELMAVAIGMYVLEVTSYRTVAGVACGESYRPAPSQVWQWVELYGSRACSFVGQMLQRGCVEAGKEECELVKARKLACPNAELAGSKEKSAKLDGAARALGLAALLLGELTILVAGLQTYFAGVVQGSFSMLTGRGVRLFTPHSSKQPF
jgi:hypothetical protein